MSSNEFHVRALYDFEEQGTTELSFREGEILLITSTSAGTNWWYARNSAGQVGAIPANYVEVINNPSGITSESTDSSNVGNYQNVQQSNFETFQPPNDVGNYLNVQQSNFETFQPPNNVFSNVETSHTGQDQTQNFMPVDWTTTQQTSWTFDQAKTNNEQESNLDSSFDSLPAIPPEQSMDHFQTTINSTNQYISVQDSDLNQNSSMISNLNPFPTSDVWYSDSTPISSIVPQQQISSLDDYPYPMTLNQQNSVYDTTSPFSNPPVNQIPPAQPPIIDEETSKTTTTKETVESPAKTKTESPKFFTLKRSKKKSETEQRRLSIGVATELSTQETKTDNSLENLSSSGSFSPKSPQNPNEPVSTSAENKTSTPRARFFDKHGIDNYLIHGSKVKSDEQVQIGFDEKQGCVFWANNPKIPPFTCRIEDPSKGTKILGLKSFIEYRIVPGFSGARTVNRRYKQFDWLHEQLVNKFRFICIPPLPGKQIAGRFEQEFIEERRRLLEMWLNRICRHPVLCASFPVQHFVTCELTEKDNKEWKLGKRKTEKDELREASWLHCVSFTTSNLTETQISTQIDAFSHEQPLLDTHMKNLSQGLTKYLERHTEVYERDIHRIGELFSKLYMAINSDSTAFGIQELSNSISKISTSYCGIAELYKTKATEGIRELNERLQEYIGILTSFPLILSIQRSGAECMKNVQQRGASSSPDINNIIHRSQVLNHVTLAEINYFQKEKVNDFNCYMKKFLNEQIQFYEKITTDLRNALATFH